MLAGAVFPFPRAVAQRVCGQVHSGAERDGFRDVLCSLRCGVSKGRTELARVEREIRKLVQAIKDGVSALSIRDELLSLEEMKAELQSRLEAPDMP